WCFACGYCRQPSAWSGDLVGHDEVGFLGTAVGVADASGELVGRQEAVGFDNAALAVDPGGLNGVEPGALTGQVAGDDADTGASPLDPAIVVADPAADEVADVPGGVVPDQ